MQTLVLNASFEPLHLIDWKDAFCMLLSEKAELVSEYADRAIRSISASFKMPRIIRLRKYVNLARHVATMRYSRRNVFLRDNNECQYCGKVCTKKEATLDHVMPRSRGGESSWSNTVLACKRCNTKKDNKTPQEAGMRLLNEPKAPKPSSCTLYDLIRHHGFSFDPDEFFS